MKKSFKLPIIAFSLFLSLGLVACGGKADPAVTPAPTVEDPVDPVDVAPEYINPVIGSLEEDTLYVGTTAHNGHYNYMYASSAYDVQVTHLVYDSLTDATTGIVETNDRIVEKLEISEDKLDYTFTLVDGITFSDGTPLTANDVVFTYKALADPSCTAYRLSSLEGLKDAFAYKGEEVADFVAVEALNDKTVVFHFEENLRTNFSKCEISIISEAYYPDWEKGKSEEVLSAKFDKPIGSGPYVLDDYVPGQFAKLVRTPDYWAEDSTNYLIPKIVIKFVEGNTEVDEIVSGSVDVLPSIIDKSFVLRIKDNEDSKDADKYVKLEHFKRSAFGYIGFNTRSGPSAEKEIRKAIAHALDRVTFVKEMYGEYGYSIDVPMSPASSVYENVKDGLIEYNLDLTKAAELIEAAGYTKTGAMYQKDGKDLELKFLASNNNPVVEALVPVLMDALDELGVRLNVDQVEFTTLLDIIQSENDDWNMCFLASSWTSDEPDTWTALDHSDYIPSSNTTRYSNPEVDKLLADGRKILDLKSDEAKEVYGKIAVHLNDDIPQLPIYANILTVMKNERVKDLRVNTFMEWSQGIEGAYIDVE